MSEYSKSNVCIVGESCNIVYIQKENIIFLYK